MFNEKGLSFFPAQVEIEQEPLFKELFATIQAGDIEKYESMVKKNPGLLSKKDPQRGLAALSSAIISGEADVVNFLLDDNADVNQADNRGFTPLMHLVERSSLYNDPGKLALRLLDKGADKNKSRGGWTALSIAMDCENQNLVDLLEGYSGANESRLERNGFQKDDLDEDQQKLLQNLTCPITHNILTDPVTLSTGITYEREAIQQYVTGRMENGINIICPASTKLFDFSEPVKFSTNVVIKSLADSFVATQLRITRNATSESTECKVRP